MVNSTLEISDIRDRVEKALETVRPYLETDGGDVKILDINDDMVVRIELQGACGSCPMSTMTLRAGLEESIKRAVPEIRAVEAINITQSGNPDAKLSDNMLL